MNVALFNVKPFDRASFEHANRGVGHALSYFEVRLNRDTALLAKDFAVVCPFVNDRLDSPTLHILAAHGTKLLALRSAGFNHVDLGIAQTLGLTVARVPAYSPHAVAEHAVALLLALNRKIHRAYNRVREGNFALEGLLGFDVHGKTVGVIGTGRIGQVFIKIMQGFGCQILAYDLTPSPEVLALGVTYTTLEKVLAQSDIISLHCPLTTKTHHLVNNTTIQQMKPGVMLINTSRGGLIDARALIKGLKSKHIGAVGLDVYEKESDLFFEDLSGEILQDDVFGRLITFPNVLITGHQAFLTEEALHNIAETTLLNITDFELGRPCSNTITLSKS